MAGDVTFPPELERFVSLDAFYSADERRRHSGEADYGIYWWDGPQGHSDSWRVSALSATGEIYAIRERPHRRSRVEPNAVVLLGRVADSDLGYEVADRVLEAWNLECGKGFSLGWAIERVRCAVAGDLPAPLLILCRHQQLGGHVHVDVFVGRQVGSRGKAGELCLRGDEWEIVRAGLERGFGDRLELVERADDVAPVERTD